MADFLATYGIDDKALAIGLKKIEGMASAHQESMRKKEPFGELGGQASRQIFGVAGVAKAAFGTIGTSIGFAIKATDDYAKKNSYVASQLEELRAVGRDVWTDIGRDVSQASGNLREEVGFFARMREKAANYAGAVLSSFVGPEGAQSVSQIKEQTRWLKLHEKMDLEAASRRKRAEFEAERLSKLAGDEARMKAVEAKAELDRMRAIEQTASLRAGLERAGNKEESERIKRSIELNKIATIDAERQRQSDNTYKASEETRKRLEAATTERQAARESIADLVEANAQRIFGLEASQRQIQIAETQLRYDKQIRDLAQDKALLEEDRARAAGLLAEQRDAELGILMAQKDAQKTGRSIAIGSSQDARQAFAPVLNEERSDRKMAQQKFDRMISELAKIRSNTGQTQVATYQ